MNIINKYPKTFQWIFLMLVFFGLCFAIDVPENYKFYIELNPMTPKSFNLSPEVKLLSLEKKFWVSGKQSC